MSDVDDLPNGFTGFSRREPGFVSAGEAIRQAERAAAQAASQDSSDQGGDEDWRANVSRASSEGPGIWELAREGVMRCLKERTSDDEDDPRQFDPEKLDRIDESDRRWAWTEIDLSAIRHNVLEVRSLLRPGTRLMAVVKADAYGHGAVQCARTALGAGAEYLGVATVDEGVQLRKEGISAPLLVLSEPPATSVPLLLAHNIMPSVYTVEFAMQYAEAADAIGVMAPFHLKVNTGMNRIGVRHDEVVSFMSQVGFHRALDLVGTFTHFATADCPETLDLNIQFKRFGDAVSALRAAGIDPGIVHAANSAAIIRYPETHLDMVRLGISLYGFYPCPETYGTISLEPAMSVHARITDTKLVAMSEGVSYGLRYRSPGSVRICTLPIGYADGLRRGLSGNTNFIIDGTELRQVGTICMDQCMFEADLRTYGTRRRVDPQIGDEVLVVGAQGDAVVTIDEMAEKLGTVQHEIAIGFGCSRLARIYR